MNTLHPASNTLARVTLGLALSIAAYALPVQAATISGMVGTVDGKPVAGALVTLWNEAHDRKETVYSDAGGRYTLSTGFSGKLALRGRAYLYRDFNVTFDLPANARQNHNLALEPMTDEREISDSLTASAHAAQLPFPNAETKRLFISQCSFCHQQGNALTRQPRAASAWNDTVWRMEGYGALITYSEHKRIVELLTKGYAGDPTVKAIQTHAYFPEQASARIEEWLAGDAVSFIHDTIVGEDGLLYGVDQGNDVIHLLDPATGKLERIPMPVTPDMPVGGRMTGMQLPIGIYNGRHGPHSAVQLKDGRIFITASLSGRILEFNPKTREWKHHPIPEGFLWRKGLYPHTIRVDQDQKIWFTVTVSNRVMKYDPDTEAFTDIALPSGGVTQWLGDVMVGVIMKVSSFFPAKNLQLYLSHHKIFGAAGVANWPYGIDVNPLDNSVWYSKLLGNKIGVVNRDTLTVTEYDTPFKGPRRMRFDAKGILWIPSFEDSKLMRFDPKTKAFESIDLPVLAKNEYEMPYVLSVHPQTGDLWIAANNSDRVLRYIPNEKRFIAYPMPNRVIWFRDFEFTKEGKVCASNANLPAYAHEDGRPAFVCIDPHATAGKN